ncbi:MAG: chemotaxis protein CheW [Acidobacteria bacterium]|nr:chemotaxis protein CheW [Acidobacteriota bacterium]
MDLAKIRKKAKKGAPKPASKEKSEKQEEIANQPEEESMPFKDEPEKALEVNTEKKKSKSAEEQLNEVVKEALKQAVVPIETQELEIPPIVTEETAIKKQKEKKLEKLLIFKVGRNRSAIPIGELSQIIEDREITPIPFVPPFLKGIFSLRGRIVGVIDVLERMKLNRKEDSLTRKIIVLEKEGDLFGLRVDGIDHVVEVDTLSLEPPPEGFDLELQEFVVGVFHFRKKTVALLNLDAFLNF